ncbi:MAG TPA: trigger factor [bacterium]|nr:trigger factor [bacterium]
MGVASGRVLSEGDVKVDVRREPGSKAVLEVEVPIEVVSAGFDRALRKLNNRVVVPGFRKGKAPRSMLERHVGRGTVVEEAVNQLVPDAYTKALDQTGVRPIARPQFQVADLEEGKPLRFTATVDLVPEVGLGDYRTIRVPYQAPEVSEADVDAAVEDLRGRQGHLVPTDKPAEQGDFVLVRAVELSGPVERFTQGKEYLIEVGGGTHPAEVESALVGSTVGTRPAVSLGEQTVTFEVVDVKRRELPVLDDEFAKELRAQDVADLRRQQRGRLEQERTQSAREAYEEAVISALLEGTTIDLPASLVDHEVEHLVADLTDALQRRGLTFPRYLEATGKDEAAVRDEFRPSAERRLRTQLALDEVARAAALDPSPEEIDREVENVARRLQQDVPRVREWLNQTDRLSSLTGTLRRQKALAHLVTVARGEHA